MGGKRKHSQRRLTDQGILERCVQNFTHKQFTLREYRSFREERRDIWKRILIAIFLAGPFVTLIPLMAWLGMIPPKYLALLPGVNAVFLFLIALSFHIASKKIETFPFSWEQHAHFLSSWFFSILSWLALWTSLTVLLASVGFVRIHKALWWVLFTAYAGGGVGLWMGRKAILRAIVEGPKAHPWFWPIRLFSSISLGFCIFLTAVGYIFFRWLGEKEQDGIVGLSLLALQALALSLLFLGLAMIAGIVAYLHYQKWRGAEKLRI